MRSLTLTLLTLLSLSSFAQSPSGLSRDEAKSLSQEIYIAELTTFADSFAQESEDCIFTNGEYRMPFWYSVLGDFAEGERPMYISMHGGGGTTAELNDQQWVNQARLYGEVDGIYFVPRAPTDSWNMWHQEYMEDFLLKAVVYGVAKLGADPSRIYLTGYSAGGDGTFNLATRLSDRFAAAAMMAGHPGDAVAENLRNLPFAIYMGGLDDAYNRNGLAAEWGVTLDNLQSADPKGYKHRVVIYEGKGHWMDNEDKEAIGWMAQFTRNTAVDKIVWVQDDVLAHRKYNLEVQEPKVGANLTITINKQTNSINIEKSDYSSFKIWLNDEVLDLDKEVRVIYEGEVLFSGMVERTKENIEESISGRYDRDYVFSGSITIKGTPKN
ncbi:MAG: alpha/beta hydrolase [Rikenellaceae bacterium]